MIRSESTRFGGLLGGPSPNTVPGPGLPKSCSLPALQGAGQEPLQCRRVAGDRYRYRSHARSQAAPINQQLDTQSVVDRFIKVNNHHFLSHHTKVCSLAGCGE